MRLLAEIAGIIYLRSGRFHVKKAAQKQYQRHGLNAFFLPMLEAAVTGYNWGYLDSWRLYWKANMGIAKKVDATGMSS